ncbi:MAG: PorV/PorQ family protein [Flavobacteriales bacterium]
MKVISFFFILLSFSAFTQYDVGNNAFSGFEQVTSCKSSGVGARYFALPNGDLSTTLDQAALLDSKMNGAIHSSFGILPSGVNFGVFTTAFQTKIGTLAPCVRYINYGHFTETNTSGDAIGTFNAMDYQLGMSYAYAPNPFFRLGVQVNLLGSQLERYNAFGVSTTYSALLIHPKQLLTAAFGLRNFGVVFKDYTASANSILPLDAYVALSYKLAHAPFRFHVVGHSLNRPNNIWLDPNATPTYDPLTGDTIAVYTPNLGERIANHLQFQLELVPKGAFQLRMGFNYNRRQQLKVNDFPGLAGFSVGTSLHIKKFDLDYAVQFYSKAGSIHSIGLSTDLQRWKKKI